jgi:hypothetical protein
MPRQCGFAAAAASVCQRTVQVAARRREERVLVGIREEVARNSADQTGGTRDRRSGTTPPPRPGAIVITRAGPCASRGCERDCAATGQKRLACACTDGLARSQVNGGRDDASQTGSMRPWQTRACDLVVDLVSVGEVGADHGFVGGGRRGHSAASASPASRRP